MSIAGKKVMEAGKVTERGGNYPKRSSELTRADTSRVNKREIVLERRSKARE
jgi:hypothetical protein